MAKSIFRLSSSYKGQIKSIKSISSEIIDLVFELKNINTSFDRLLYVSDIKPINIAFHDKKEAVLALSECILNSYIDDIKQQNNDKEVSADYSWNEGFRVSIILEYKSESCFKISGQFGCKSYPELNIENFKKEYSFDWYISALKSIIKLFEPNSASIDLDIPVFRQLVNEIGVWPPLGWVTYFSNDYEMSIPDDLEGIEYEHTDKGKYLILTRDDITKDTETFQLYKSKLLGIMEVIKRRVPEYAK